MRKHTKRKVWYRKLSGLEIAISGATITTQEDLDKLRMRELSAIEAFAKGVATPNEFRDVCDMLNLAQTMGETGIGAEVLPTVEAVEAELLQAKERFEKHGRMALTGPGLTALRDLFEYHDLQRSSVDRSTYERAIERTRNKIRGAHPDVKVLA